MVGGGSVVVDASSGWWVMLVGDGLGRWGAGLGSRAVGLHGR